MTEEQAKKKMCPLLSIGNGAASCVGTHCMAWRWDSVDNPNYSPFMAQMGGGGKEIPIYLKSETDGHCGMANG